MTRRRVKEWRAMSERMTCEEAVAELPSTFSAKSHPAACTEKWTTSPLFAGINYCHANGV